MFQYGKGLRIIDVNMVRVIERFVRPRGLVDISASHGSKRLPIGR